MPVTPQRLLDTRQQRPRVWPDGTVELPVSAAGAGCGGHQRDSDPQRPRRIRRPPSQPARLDLPTSTLNPAMFDHTLANLAITQLSDRGLGYYSHAGVDLAVDVTGISPAHGRGNAAAAHPTHRGTSRVLMVGDSTLAGLHLHPESHQALVGFEPIVDAASCRRLVRTSCKSAVTGLIPNTAVEAILGTPGTLDIVVIKTGYNDWNSNFPGEFDAVVNASRRQGRPHDRVDELHRGRRQPAGTPGVHREQHRPVPARTFAAVQRRAARRLARLHRRLPRVDMGRKPSHRIRRMADDRLHLAMGGCDRAQAVPAPVGPRWRQFDPCPVPDSIGLVPNVTALY